MIFLFSSAAVEPHIWFHAGQINARLLGNDGLTPPKENVVLGVPYQPLNYQKDFPPSFSFPSTSLTH